MKRDNFKNAVERLFAHIGIEINGAKPWDIRVHNEAFYRRVLREGSLGLGESYVEGWWDCDRLDDLSFHILGNQLAQKIRWDLSQFFPVLLARLSNRQSQAQAFNIAKAHYDLGNLLYEKMLDPRMVYSCGYWNQASNLAEAQAAKMNLICNKLRLTPGMKILDIGCGWGSFAKYAAEQYNVSAVGVTVSKEQARLATKLCSNLPVEIRLQDYRDTNERFDHIVSIGMFEHVGYKNYRAFMEVVHKCLAENGLFLLHTIGANTSQLSADPWIDKYIFPGGMYPSVKQIGAAAEGLFVMEDWHNFGADYERTLLAWHENFERHWPELEGIYNQEFYRMWRYFLLMCAGGFRARHSQLWQIVFSKKGVCGGYKSIR